MADFIKPTVGRKVYYVPNKSHVGDDGLMVQFPDTDGNEYSQKLDATIVYVWNDTTVNLVVLDHAGNSFKRPYVSINCGEIILPRAEWMPFQKGQAAKTDTLVEELGRVKNTHAAPPPAADGHDKPTQPNERLGNQT